MTTQTQPRPVVVADPPVCCCFEYPGDNDLCPIHRRAPKPSSSLFFDKPIVTQFEREPDEHLLDGCDTSMNAQLDEAGYGSGGVL